MFQVAMVISELCGLLAQQPHVLTRLVSVVRQSRL